MTMRRRDFMRAVLAATVAPSAIVAQTVATPMHEAPPAPGPVPWMQGLDSVKPEIVATVNPEDVAQSDLRFFNPVQMATLSRLSEILLPPLNGYPGAREAETPQFLDFFVSESAPEIKLLYQRGIDRLDSEAKQQFDLPFAQLNPTQADSLLRPWLTTWMPDHYPAASHERFISVVHHDIRTATINSQAWADAAGKTRARGVWTDLYWSPVEPDVHRQNFNTVSRAIHDGVRTNQVR